MKLKQFITGGALAATVLTLGSAQAETNYNGIVFCKAKIVSETGDPIRELSITLPTTPTIEDGELYTYWNIGEVAAGGVADTWHAKGGPGRFTAHNNGRMGAFVYLTSSRDSNYPIYGGIKRLGKEILDASGNFRRATRISPTPSLQYWRDPRNNDAYCLAFTRDVMAKVPTWHMLNMFCNDGHGNFLTPSPGAGWKLGDDCGGVSECIGAYMGYLDAGDYMPFDVKFWAPRMKTGGDGVDTCFTFMVEAAPFPLWEHDADVQ